MYRHIINVARAMSLDDLEGFEKRMEAATPRNIIQQYMNTLNNQMFMEI